MRLALGMTPSSAAVRTDRTQSFAVSSIHQGRQSLLLLRGELDVATVPDLVVLLRLCIDLGQERIVLDLRELTFIGAVGLALLVEGQRRLQQQGGELVVRHPPPFTFKLLRIVGLASLCETGDGRLAGSASRRCPQPASA